MNNEEADRRAFSAFRKAQAERGTAQDLMGDAASALREQQAEIERLRGLLTRARPIVADEVQRCVRGFEPAEKLLDDIDAALREVDEQARLLGMGSEREARLMAENERLEIALVRYGHHDNGCPVLTSTTVTACECGYRETLEEKS